MKKKIVGIMMPFLVSILFGYCSGKLVYNIYNDDMSDKFSSSLVYLLEGDTYLTYDGMRMDNSLDNYVYYVEDGEYKTVFGITKNVDNVNKINKLYDNDLNVFKYYVSNDKLNDKQDLYDNMLNDSTLEEDIKVILNDILDMYKEDNTVRLVLID